MSTTNSARGQRLPVANLKLREHVAKDGTRTTFYECYFPYGGNPKVWRRVGPAWMERVGDGWRKRSGRVPDGFYDERTAHVRAAGVVADYARHADELKQAERERQERGVTFREVAHDYLRWLEKECAAKPSTLRDHGYMLAEPGTQRKRGAGTLGGRIMAALGDQPADEITGDQIKALLSQIGDGRTPRTHNKHRNFISAIFNFGRGHATGYRLTNNPAEGIKHRREPEPDVLAFYTVEEVEAIARAMTEGLRRDRSRPAVSESEAVFRAAQDAQDGEAVRIAAYFGLRQGELVELRWKDVDWSGSALTISRAVSANSVTTTKSRKIRRVPMSDQGATALEGLSRRADFTTPDELVVCNLITGRRLDGSALRKRYEATVVLLGLEPLTWHQLRHTCGSLLAAAGVDPVTIKDALGHSSLAVTQRYLHARPATQTAALFTAAFAANAAPKPTAATAAVA